MSSDVKFTRIDELLEVTSSKRIHMADYVKSGIPFYRSKEVIERSKGNKISTELFISREQFESIDKKFGRPKDGDILLTSVGTLGVPYQIQGDGDFYFKDGNLTWMRNFTDKINSRFLYYWLTSPKVQQKLDEISIGSTQKALTISAIKSLEIPLPTIKVQDSIVEMLDSISNRISLLKETNATFDAISQILFKSWFLDFDPVHSKQQGIMPEGMNEAIASLFPDSFEESILGLIPSGWKVGTLGDMLSLRNERVKPSAETALLPYVPIECISSKIPFLENFKSGAEANSSLTLFKHGDILFGAMRPYFHKVCIAPFDGVTRTTVFTLKARNDKCSAYALFLAFQESTIQYATQHSEGSTIPYAKWNGSLEKMPIVIPNNALQEIYSDIVSSLILRANQGIQKIQTLTSIRDILLPRLISGQLNLQEAEVLLEEITE